MPNVFIVLRGRGCASSILRPSLLRCLNLDEAFFLLARKLMLQCLRPVLPQWKPMLGSGGPCGLKIGHDKTKHRFEHLRWPDHGHEGA
jgi:hypothetical protein